MLNSSQHFFKRRLKVTVAKGWPFRMKMYSLSGLRTWICARISLAFGVNGMKRFPSLK